MLFNENDSAQIFALPGFLGHSKDWKNFDFINYPMDITHEELDFWTWAGWFNASIPKNSGKNILLGYSLGGRLAMHALLSAPDLWDGAILVSTNPGLKSEEERALRRKNDKQWSERFLIEPWNSLIHEWNKNPVFGGTLFPFSKEEVEFNRKQLARQLVNWSLGNQEPLLERLKNVSVPMLIMAGELDTKFCAIAEEFNEFSKVAIIPMAAHRVPWDQPTQFINQINPFIESIICKQSHKRGRL